MAEPDTNAAKTSRATQTQSDNQGPQPQPGLEPNRGPWRFFDPRNVIGFLWLGPALAILILNFRNHIIGSGLNCRSHCRIDPYSTSQVEQIERLDSTNRDVLGALQFVAKGLEVWFMYVAASFIYILAVHISLKDDRLPVSLLLVYAEFMDLLYLKDLAMRIRGFLKERTGAPDPPTIHSWVLYVFVLVAACLCVIANLMGVATATLVIPGLQYIDINMHDSTAFNQLLSADPPTGDFIRDCTPGNLSSGQYSCTSNLYASSLDQLILSAVSTERHQAAYGAFTLPAVSQEDELSLSANVSREFSADLQNFYEATGGRNGSLPDYSVYPDSRRFNQSLQSQLQRTGPAIGLFGDCWSYPGPRVFRLADDRSIRCYGDLFTTSDTTVTKCIRWGAGWDDAASASSASFIIPDFVSQSDTPFDITVTVYTTPSARYLHDTACFEDESCDWGRIFSDPADAESASFSDSQQTYQYDSDGTDRVVWCDNTAYLSFATYAVDPSPVSNLLHLAQLGVLRDRPDTDTESNRDRAATLTLHADWTLAAWSADATDGLIDGSRGSSTSFIIAYQRFIQNPAVGNTRFNLIHTYSTLQAASLIPYTTRTLSTSSDRRLQREREDSNPYTAATLTSWATVQLWKYGIDSRTKTLGAVILIIGMAVVIATTIMWIESPQAPTRVVIAALFHDRPEGLDEEDVEEGAPVRAIYKYREKKRPVRGEEEVPVEKGRLLKAIDKCRGKRPKRSSTVVFRHRNSMPLEAPAAGGTGAGDAAVLEPLPVPTVEGKQESAVEEAVKNEVA